MSEETNDRWLRWVALSTAFMAVFAAITTMYMGKYSSRAVLLQGQESDTWAHYQAKSIKSHNYEMQRDNLELQLLVQEGRISRNTEEKIREGLGKCNAELARYEKEKKELMDKANGLAKKKLTAQEMGGNYGYSLIFLQISIMLSSLASLTKRKYLWYIGLASLIGWLFFFADALLLFY